MVLGLPSVPSRRSEAICSSSAIPTLVSSSFVHVVVRLDLFSVISGNVLCSWGAPLRRYPHGGSVTTREPESAPVRKTLLIQVLIDPPSFTREAVALRAWTTGTRSESSWPRDGPGSAPSRRDCPPTAPTGAVPGCAGRRWRCP